MSSAEIHNAGPRAGSGAAGPDPRAGSGAAGPDPRAATGAAGPDPRAATGAAARDPRPLRRDAERNRLRILRAASEVFTERGLQATLDDVAGRAGVGVGTVYRRFPDKEALVEALFTERLDTLAAFAEQALAEPDPWTGLATFLEQAASVIAGDRGLRQILMFATYGRDRVDQARARMLPVVARMVQRAQEAGDVRADLRPTDVPLIEFMLSAAAEYAGQVRPDIWRRYLALILDGLRPSRTVATVLPEPALTPDEMVQAMRSGTLSRSLPAAARRRPASLTAGQAGTVAAAGPGAGTSAVAWARAGRPGPVTTQPVRAMPAPGQPVRAMPAPGSGWHPRGAFWPEGWPWPSWLPCPGAGSRRAPDRRRPRGRAPSWPAEAA